MPIRQLMMSWLRSRSLLAEARLKPMSDMFQSRIHRRTAKYSRWLQLVIWGCKWKRTKTTIPYSRMKQSFVRWLARLPNNTFFPMPISARAYSCWSRTTCNNTQMRELKDSFRSHVDQKISQGLMTPSAVVRVEQCHLAGARCWRTKRRWPLYRSVRIEAKSSDCFACNQSTK